MIEIIIFFLGTAFTLGILAVPIYLLVKVSSLSRRIGHLERILNQSPEVLRQSQAAFAKPPGYSQAKSPVPGISQSPPETHPATPTGRGPVPAAGVATDTTTAAISDPGSTASTVPASAQAGPVAKSAVAPAGVSPLQRPEVGPRNKVGASHPSTAPESTATPAVQKSDTPDWWKKLERSLAENWTGILGTLILVVGVGFLGVYAALNMGPFTRFLMVLGIAAALFAASLFLVRHNHWKPVAYWLRSGAGAVLLVACLGSALFPAMQWIHDENLALAVILAGVAANLALSWWASSQAFASIHTVLAVATVLILPKSALLFSIVGGISVFSTYLSYRAKWEFHLLQAVSVFFLASLIYGMHYGAPEKDVEPAIRWIGLVSTGAVSILALLIHYRSRYRARNFERWPFISHIVTWATAASGFALYSTGSKYNTIVLLIIAALVYAHARRARKSETTWLYRTDSIMALFIAIFGALTLERWQWDALATGLVISFLLFAFSVAASLEKETLLRNLGAGLLQFCWLSILTIAAAEADPEKLIYQTAIALIGLLLTVIYIWFDTYQAPQEPLDTRLDATFGIDPGSALSPAGIFAGLFLALVAFLIRDLANAEYYVAALALAILVARHTTRMIQLVSGFFPAILALHALVIYRAMDHGPALQLFTDAPLLALLVAATLLCTFKNREAAAAIQSRLSVGLLVAHLAVLIFVLTEPLSSLLPGVLWLLLSVFLLEGHTALRRQESRAWLKPVRLSDPVLFLGALMFVALFLISHFIVHLQSESLLGPVRARLLIQIFAIGVFLYWALSQPVAEKHDSGILHRIPTGFWELAILFVTIAFALEMDLWLPVVWVLVALLLAMSRLMHFLPARLSLYSMAFFWTSVIHTSFISSSSPSPSHYWADQSWLAGILAIAGQLGYLILHYTYLAARQKPGTLDWLSARMEGMTAKLQDKRDLALFYPLFLSVALFLFWTFDSSLLTLLWMIEVFVVFFVGLKLNQDHFRYVAQGAMVLCLIRLIFFDLSQSSIVMRAFVFLGVGGIMILMNVIYRRFRTEELKTDAEKDQ
ncbi:MAG: hypothetical protein CMN76_13710 [Spirochaetaceae bacterium]|nr:hypothetical protein [Spirochaetaceae bacterium]|tara:strand:+ start:295143 stop:298307 length:3165 start_codon:yes stop_codon:yes gene_type:complete